ncbi:MAG: GNAT family N-acetyltransferase [Planctomycetes bacterium]|nr:GNAT family N-acetyltransferase [Planctomycetota bacterium]MBL7007984.1 GNAT family N-acetyltransferase [Planctomycetota bacterium]
MSLGSALARALRKLRSEGPMGVMRALKWKFYRHKVMIVCRRELALPVFEVKRLMLPERISIVLATLDHLDLMAANFPQKRDWYRQRLQTPGYYCSIALLDGEVLAHNWFCTCPHFDPEMRCEIVPEPGEAYCFEGWCTPEWRGRGISYLGLNHGLEEVLPPLGVDHVVTYLEPSNRPTRKFHKRYGFIDVGRKVHLRLGPLRFNSKIKPLRPKDRS